MFDLGFQELVVIFVVALLVFGPKRLPELARNMGKAVGQLRKAMMDVKAEVEKEAGEATAGAKETLKHDLPSWKDKAVPDIPGAGATSSGAASPDAAGGQDTGAQPSEKKPGDSEGA